MRGMKNLIRYTKVIFAASALSFVVFKGATVKMSQIGEVSTELPKIEVAAQLDQALELLEKRNHVKILSVDASTDMRPVILNIVRKSMPKAYQAHAFEIARAVITEANHHKMDPFFLLAVIKTESSFRVKARGSHGEIGLMQILPKTAAWLAAQAGVSEAQLNLEDPSINIRIGATYFAQLRRNFEGHGGRYVAAYNMGSTNVRRLVSKNIEPTIYPSRVLGNYNKFYKNLSKNIRAAQTQQIAAN